MNTNACIAHLSYGLPWPCCHAICSSQALAGWETLPAEIRVWQRQLANLFLCSADSPWDKGHHNVNPFPLSLQFKAFLQWHLCQDRKPYRTSGWSMCLPHGALMGSEKCMLIRKKANLFVYHNFTQFSTLKYVFLLRLRQQMLVYISLACPFN